MDLRYLLPCSIAELTRRLGAKNYGPIHRIISGKRRPRIPLAKRIEAATGGAIRAVWLLGLEDPPPPAQRVA